ncbi:hypothetical protein Airi01_071190 [Actinoallomurus iriomotensis]|uniref:GerMN domain-containing protein n=2 Tax=Actinoallomurus iriomotensis TaxID=478107 RepID=A0A9W6RRJ3_9ACTN|nr:hypothetical protein Airi01_071190 [Actinoallomurus iriomotensis]
MRRMRIWPAVVVLLLAGCGVRPSGVADGGEAPTGVAPGVTLYFVGARGELSPQLRRTGHLGGIPEAMALLLSGPGESGLRTDISASATTQVVVTVAPGVIRLLVPLSIHEVTPLGIDQIVCTALGVHIQSGGSKRTEAQVRFTLPTPESDKRRTCPLFR